MLVGADIRAEAHDVFAREIADVFDDLGRVDGAVGAGVRGVVHGGVVEGEAGCVGEAEGWPHPG